MSIHAINHVQLGFPAGRHAQLRHFYTELLGLPEVDPGDGRTLRFRAGPQRIDLVPVEGWRPPQRAPRLALEVRNLPGLRARLADAGLAVDESRVLPGHLRFYAQDPAGNGLEFLEPLQADGGAA
ncbi:MAG: VOC family protein [Curvibacter sp.]|jgi:catechol 2,3-dioxygenase-like lactoylglutathione lyase family enzyme|nr:VOC family protein [Curvibacter sp.]